MDSTDRVSTVALAVSLVALIVALLQLLAQFFGTADGYRRCSESIIGPWHWLRWRRWLWTEFRYETNFVTPTIWLDSPSSRCPTKAFRLSEVQFDLDYRAPSHRSLISWSARQDEARDAEWVLKSTISPIGDAQHCGTRSNTDEHGLPPRSSHHPSETHRDVKGSLHRGTMFRVRGTRYASPNENAASWLTLIRTLYGVYDSYPRRRPNTSGLRNDEFSAADAVVEDEKSPGYAPALSQQRSDVAVSLSSYSWDAMPTDVPRPLAQTQLGPLVILAIRMGMEWQRLDVSRGYLLASGNGYSLSFVEMQSLGWVARMNETGTHSHPPAIAPGRAAEKFMCGIIPGCRPLVDKDLHCISSDGNINVFKALQRGLPLDDFAETVRRKIGERDYPMLDRAFDNDVLSLLCEFLAVPNSAACGHYTWLWRWAPRPASFHLWETRYALRKHLLGAAKAQELSPTLSKVLRFFNHLEQVYPSDFYALWEQSVLRDPSQNARQEMSNLLHDCHAIFEWTSQWFLEHRYDKREHESDTIGDKGHSRYVHLVIAHWRMSYAAVDTARANANSRYKGKRNRSKVHKAYGLEDVPVAYEWFQARSFELITACIEALGANEVVDYMSSRGFSDDEGRFNEAWWVLMLRGHVWDLATKEVSSYQKTNGQPIPSILYEDATPIWIS